MFLGSTHTDESAGRAVVIALYPKPTLNRVARKSIPFSTERPERVKIELTCEIELT